MIARKPVSVGVGTSSTLVVPPVRPKSTDVTDWAATTAYSVGDIVETTSGLRYWATVAGTSSTTEPSHTDGDATDGGVTWRSLRPQRNALEMVNDSTVVIYLAEGFAAELNKGRRLNPNGGSIYWGPEDRPPQGAVYAIAASGSGNNLTVQER